MSGSTSKTMYTFFVNNREHQTAERELAGARLKELTGTPADYELFQVRGAETVPVGNEEILRLHETAHCHFRAIPACTFGNNVLTA